METNFGVGITQFLMTLIVVTIEVGGVQLR